MEAIVRLTKNDDEGITHLHLRKFLAEGF